MICFRAGFLSHFPTLEMKAVCSSETTAGSQWSTRRYVPEDNTLHSDRCENLRYYRSTDAGILYPSSTARDRQLREAFHTCGCHRATPVSTHVRAVEQTSRSHCDGRDGCPAPQIEAMDCSDRHAVGVRRMKRCGLEWGVGVGVGTGTVSSEGAFPHWHGSENVIQSVSAPTFAAGTFRVPVRSITVGSCVPDFRQFPALCTYLPGEPARQQTVLPSHQPAHNRRKVTDAEGYQPSKQLQSDP
jgi:hypothetical protein